MTAAAAAARQQAAKVTKSTAKPAKAAAPVTAAARRPAAVPWSAEQQVAMQTAMKEFTAVGCAHGAGPRGFLGV